MRRMRRIRITKPLVVRRRSSADSPALHTLRAFARYLLVLGVCLLSFAVAEAFAEELDLEKLDGPTAIRMMEEGKLTSVRLTRAYLERIDALNKRFDPKIHEAISTLPIVDPAVNGLVLDQLEPGYRFGETLLRPARVVVAKFTAATRVPVRWH